ncbi:MAG TPA: WS/DGAT domain-containing protein [Fluviicoccus sp.]|nr:WS/DGAT domain-containing protein [Fluviicoccus sp.]
MTTTGIVATLKFAIRAANLLGLLGLFLDLPHVLPGFLACHLTATMATVLLAFHLKRSVPGWGLGALILPFITSTWLTFRPENTPDAMTAGDNCWYSMEREVNHMIVVGILFFERAPEKAALEQLITERLLKFDRFRQVPRLRNGHRYWVDDEDFQLERHLHFRPLPEPSLQTFQERVDTLSGQKLDFEHPLWDLEVVPNHPDGAAIIVRIHHCNADGIALVRVLLSLTDKAATAVENTTEAPRASRPKHHPLKLLWELIVAFPRMLMLPDSRTSFKHPLTGRRGTAWSGQLPLQDIKQLAHAHGGKINDVVLAATAGAVRRYFQQNNEPVDGITFRVLVPVNVRPLDGPIVLGNQVGFIYLPLPVGVADPVGRLRAVKAGMDAIKSGKEAVLAYFSLSVMGTLPRGVQHALMDAFNDNASSTMTNVPGPREQLFFAGEAIRNMVFFGPQSGKMGVGLSVFSYQDTLTMGISADKGMIPHPEVFTACFEQELREWLAHPG